jgi:hypothetical protein
MSLQIRYTSDGTLDLESVQRMLESIVTGMNNPKLSEDQLYNAFRILQAHLFNPIITFVKKAYVNRQTRNNPYWIAVVTLFSTTAYNMAICVYRLSDDNAAQEWASAAAQHYPQQAPNYTAYISDCDMLYRKATINKGALNTITLSDLLKRAPQSLEDQLSSIASHVSRKDELH